MNIYSFERKYTLSFIIITILFSSIIGQLPYVSLILNTFLFGGGMFILAEKINKNYKFPYSNRMTLYFFGLLLFVSLLHRLTFIDVKFFFLTFLQLFILGSGYKFENQDVFLKTLRLYLKTFIYIVSFLSLLSLLLYCIEVQFSYGGLKYIRFFDGVFDGLFLNPNTIGYLSFMSIAYIYLIKVSGKMKWILWLCLCVNIICLLLCKSRTSLGALLIFLFVYKMLQASLIKQWIMLVAFLLAGGTMLVYGENMMNIVAALFNKGQDDFFNGRGLLWVEGLAALDKFYMWGTGYGNFSGIMLAQNPDLEFVGFLGGGLHNFYLQTAVIFGIGVLLFFIALLVTILRVKLQRAEQLPYNLLTGMKSFVVAICFIAFFEVHMLYVANILNTFFWIFIGVLLLTKSKNGEAIIYRCSLL